MELKNSSIQRVLPPTPTRKLPILVTCVLKELGGYSDPTIKQIKEYCHLNNIMFETRIYNSWTYRYDRDEIKNLPAFHISINNIWNRTFYPNTRPYQHIQETIAIYNAQQEKKQKVKKTFRIFLDRFLKYIREIGKHKTKLEIAAEIAHEKQKYRGNSFLNLKETAIDWE